VGCCECGDEPFCSGTTELVIQSPALSIKDHEFLEQLGDCQFQSKLPLPIQLFSHFVTSLFDIVA
jgi:hypothetical protein